MGGRWLGIVALALSAWQLVGCESRGSAASTPEPKEPAKPTVSDAGVGTWRFPAPRRLVAIGDVHGDFQATVRALRIGGLIDADHRWTGGDTVLVQTGDVLDRGDDEQRIVDLLVELKEQAKAAGGVVHTLHGNHELMNAAGDFRYVTPGGFADFEDAPGLSFEDSGLSRFPRPQRARAAAWLPGGAYAKKIAQNPVVLVVGDTVFAHGGVLPKHVDELDRVNREVTAWLLGDGPAGRRHVSSPDSPVWSRHFSDEPDEADCRLLEETLKRLGVRRMVVGHTVQPRIRPACDQRVWRVDVGMAAHYGGKPEVLEITDDTVRAVAAPPP